MRKSLFDWFITGLLFMILTAWLKPGIGMDSSPVNLGIIIDTGIILIFFFYGLKTDFANLKTGISNWPMHIFIQLTTFLIFPLLVLPLCPLFRGTDFEIFWMGLFFLAALPSTISSSVIMVSIARGNIPGAVFNASISGIIGIILTPLWMRLFLSFSSNMFDFFEILLELFMRIILPIIAGLLINRLFRQWIYRYLPKQLVFDKIIILLIVYKSFSQSFMAGIFSSIKWFELGVLFLLIIGLFYLVIKLTGIISRLMNFSRENRITFQFVGCQKSLVHGSVFASVLFANSDDTALWLIPVMIYHSYQLLYFSLRTRKV